jgi:hypothetical protein
MTRTELALPALMESTVQDKTYGPCVALPFAMLVQGRLRSISKRWDATALTSLNRCPCPIMRVTSAAVVAIPKIPTDRTSTAMRTSMIVKPFCFLT